MIKSMLSQVDLYREMSTLSARMVEAAQANNWDELIELQNHVAALRDHLMRLDGNDALNADEIDLKRTLIQRILDNDAEVRRHTEPWMEHVRQYLGAANRRQQVERAYGAS